MEQPKQPLSDLVLPKDRAGFMEGIKCLSDSTMQAHIIATEILEGRGTLEDMMNFDLHLAQMTLLMPHLRRMLTEKYSPIADLTPGVDILKILRNVHLSDTEAFTGVVFAPVLGIVAT